MTKRDGRLRGRRSGQNDSRRPGRHRDDYLWGVDREAVAREVRRRQVTESLDFEREREKTIDEQIELVIVEIEGPKVDAVVFERMSAEDAVLVKEELALPDSGGGDFIERDDVIGSTSPPTSAPRSSPD